MYSELEISRFRAFKSVKIAPLNRLNLISGDNNIGKTGVLEAIYLAHADTYERLRAMPSLFRRTQEGNGHTDRSQDISDNFWLWLFHKRNVAESWGISLQGGSPIITTIGQLKIAGPNGIVDIAPSTPPSSALLKITNGIVGVGQTHSFFDLEGGLRPHANNPTSAHPAITAVSTRFSPPSDDAELVNVIAVRNEEDELVEYLRLVEPRLAKLKYLRLEGHKFPYVYADIGFGRGKELIPATQLGQGFARLLSLFATIMVKGTKILLIDEFENGLQHEALAPIWRSLDQIARNRGIQVFATTHSYECIRAAHEAAAEGPDYDLGVIRLQWSREKEVEALVLDREMIETALEHHLEVR